MAVFTENDNLKKELINQIEDDLYLLGIVAIEDALQENVTKTLDVFIKTGIKVWMLTGDQRLTAESIAKSCKLITEEFHVYKIDEIICENRIKEELDEALLSYESKYNVKQSLLIGTHTMGVILNSKCLTKKVLFNKKISINKKIHLIFLFLVSRSFNKNELCNILSCFT